ncbi:MAG: phasin family protein [Ramlibacter sp.]
MSTRSPGRRAPAAAAPEAPPGNIMVDLLADCGREQFAMCMEASGALSRGLEAMRAIQQRTAQETATRHRAAARRLRDAAGAGNWMALPWTIWQDDLASAARYWQELAAAALEAQTEVLGCACGHVFDSESALHGVAALEALEAIPAVRTLVDGGAAIARHTLPQ